MKPRLATLEIGAYTIGPAVNRSREGYECKFGKNPQDPGGWYRIDDWHRTSIVLDSLAPGSVLDVGAGAGQFINAVAHSGRFGPLNAIDVGQFNKFHVQAGRINYEIMPATLMRFDDNTFDNVTCLEVLEHVPDDAVDRIVRELRRVCAGRLIVSVPYCEVQPWADGHVRRFNRASLRRLFPDGTLTLMSYRSARWALVEVGPSDLSREAATRRREAIDNHKRLRSKCGRMIRRSTSLLKRWKLRAQPSS